MAIDNHIDTFRLQTFKDYLQSIGATIQSNTDPWMVIRYRHNDQTHIVYKKKSGRLTFQNQAAFHYDESQGRTARRNVSRPPRTTKRKLLERDGNLCFYCHQPLTPETISIEHLLARSKGGTNDLANLVLAHKRCNEKVGNHSIKEKISWSTLNKALLTQPTEASSPKADTTPPSSATDNSAHDVPWAT